MADLDETLVWRGPFRAMPRALSTSSARALLTAFGWLVGIACLAVMPDILGLTSLHGAARAVFTLAGVIAVVLTAGIFRVARATPQRLEALLPPLVFVVFVLGPILVNVAVVIVGPDFGGVTVFFVELLLMAFFVLRRPWAVAVTVLTLALYAAALVALDDPPSPLIQFTNVLAAAVATGVLIGAFANRLDDTRSQLAQLNGRLRRFLARQVAEAVASEDDALAPHRREIALCFVDLRGFTTFTNAVDPARVVDVLAEYYAAVGTLVDTYGGTIGGFDGDGVFAFLGDPVPNEDAAAHAVAMSKEIAVSLDKLTAKWSKDGPKLGYGIGLSFGEATVGLVGFEGRLDYTPVGACVNLAARLCSDAKHREIVIDAAIKDAASVTGTRRRASVDLKGFGEVATYGVRH